ncbi:MAG TPA: TonB-dependent receptor, partial [Thermoanaerobaculia bacterium]|nr:TonB-dependent receptor [Thermoanaerobaculia bacterium]
LPAGARVRLAAGLRWDAIEEDFAGPARSPSHEAWSPRLGATLRLGRDGAATPVVHLQLARAFKAPTVDQLFDPRPFPDFAGGTFTLSNPALQPQRAASAEVGIGRTAAAGRWQVVGYRIEVENEIDFDPATFRFVNLGGSLHRGVEADAAWRPGGRWSAALGYAWTRVEPRGGEHRGRQLKNIPRHRARLALDRELPRDARLAAAWTWTGRRFLDDANRVPLPSAGALDLRLARSFGRTRLRLDLLNAFDRRFAEVGYVLPDLASGGEVPYALPAPGRALRVGFDWDF